MANKNVSQVNARHEQRSPMSEVTKQCGPLRLVKNKIAHDVVAALEQLLDLARLGEVTGIAFAATLKGERFLTDMAGTCYTHPSYARGIVAFLSDELSDHAHDRGVDDIR